MKSIASSISRCVLTLLLGLALSGCSREQAPGVTELVYATPYPPSHPFSLADQEWMDYVHERSGDSLRIVPNWSGALLSSEHSMQEIRHGVADIGLITPIYVKGGVHLIRLQSGFYSGTTTVAQQVALYRCLEAGNAQFAEELDGLKVLAVQGGSLPGIITRSKPIHRLDDLAGLRLRAPTELLNVLQELGVDAVSMPMGDVYSALAKGMLDGVIAPLDTFRSLHFAEVADHYAELVVPRGAYPARAMRMPRWEQLTEAQQAVLESGIAVWEEALARLTDAALLEGQELAIAEGVQFTPITAAEQARFDALYLQEAERNAAGLERYGIDGRAVFAVARASVGDKGEISCSGGSN
jgi:TRAP-type C4-dicarboxylate transport system substrate-binding protein